MLQKAADVYVVSSDSGALNKMLCSQVVGGSFVLGREQFRVVKKMNLRSSAPS